ncbi:MAG: histidinol-phosphate transaminase, partial [Candidatus Bathyarchaeia archaeon]
SNENFFVPLDFIRNILREVIEEIDPRIYPRDETVELKQAISRYLDVSTKEIVIGPGSDPFIDLVSRMFLTKDDEAISITPTFSIYERCVKIQGAKYKAVPLKDDFSLDTKRILASVTPRAKIIFLCSPNNPTANLFNREDFLCLTEGFDGIVAVDEAYADFSRGSVVNLAEKAENLIVFRTFSKVFGLAGLRIGYAIANQDLATVIDERFQLPYNVSLVTLKASVKMLEKIHVIKDATEKLKIEREKLIKRLNQIDGVHAFDSETNFVLFQTEKSSDIVYEELLQKGIIVRNIGRVLNLQNCLRVTVAPSHMLEKFLIELDEVLNKNVD